MKIVKVIIPKNKLFILDYKSSLDLSSGQLIIVPFRDEKIIGIVDSIQDESKVKSLKEITETYSGKIILSEDFIKFLKLSAKYYFAEIGSIMKMVLPVNLAEASPKKLIQELENTNLLELSKDQKDAYNQISSKGASVLHGLTGSGKTEIYFHKIMECLKNGKQALFMLPEIALSKQMISRFEERFNEKAIIWNASIGKSRKQRILKSILSGEVKIIIGARSALFLPYKDLGVIIVDEEHDSSYKQEDSLSYNARDMAVLRGSICNIPVILGSATPSLESFYNIECGKYNYIRLESRFGDSVLPNIIPINMRKESKEKWISNPLKEAIEKNIAKNQQVMLYLNRKGYSPFILCKDCGYRPSCTSCSSNMVYHKALDNLICHHCSYHTKYLPDCPECLSKDSMMPYGPGIERILEEVTNLFPDANIQLMSKEEMQSQKKSKEILDNIMSDKVDIIIGTQIITKGYHFPNLTLVGVIDSDMALVSNELRASESAFSLLHQLAGRAGREKIQGNIYMQSYYPDSKFMKLLKEHNFDEFIQNELEERKKAKMPPIYKIASLTITDKNEIKSKRQSMDIVRAMKKSPDISILGPAPANISKLKNQYRYRILLIANNASNLHKYLAELISRMDYKIKKTIRIDIDPYSFL